MAEISQRDFEPLSGGSPLRRLIARFADWRNQKVMDPQFQAWAMRFWLTRPLVRKRQKELFDLTAGFVYSQVLFSCVSLGVFEHLKRGAISLRALSARIGLDEDQTTRLIDAAAALKLLRRDEDGVRLADLG
ncbi:MAG: methyltransferase dimerization domain-containing protein, partial [Pseudomonadota bacterium]